MGIPDRETLDQVTHERHLKVVPATAELTVASTFGPYSRLHPSLPRLAAPDEEKLYSGLITPTRASRLRVVLHAIEEIHPALDQLSGSQIIKDHGQFMNRTITTRGVTEKFSQYAEDLSVTHEQLKRHAEDQRYRAVAAAIVALVEVDQRREADEETVIGPAELHHIGQLALFGVDPDGYAHDFRDIVKARAKAREAGN